MRDYSTLSGSQIKGAQQQYDGSAGGDGGIESDGASSDDAAQGCCYLPRERVPTWDEMA